MTRAVALALLLVAIPAAARADCAGHDEPRWLSHHALVLLLNPMGAEYNGRVGLCAPLYESASPFLSLNHVEGGASVYLSPVYFVPGGYVQLTPLSFLVFRAELAAIGVWPIPLGGAGFYERSSLSDGWQRADLPAEDGGSAFGWSARFRAVLRGAVDIAPNAEIVLVYTPWLEINSFVDRGPYWSNVRDDVVSGNGGWVFAHEGVLLLGTRVPDGPTLRFGGFTALRNVPESGYVGHRAGPFVMASFGRPDPAVESVDVFLRLSVYTHHRFRLRQAATMLGLSVDWDMGGL